MKKIFFAAAFFVSGSLFFSETVDEILKVYCDLDRVPDYNYSSIAVDNISKNGAVEHMDLEQFGGGANGLKNTVFSFKSPSSVKDTRILQAEKISKEDDQWVFMPALRTTRRIAPGDKGKPFVGTELTYNDLSLRKEHDDKNEIISQSESVTVNGVTYDCWKMKSVPVKKNTVEYGYRISWFDKKSYIPVRIEFYDKKNASKLIKTYEVEKLEQVKGATGMTYWLRRQNLVTNIETGRKTRVTVKEYVFDKKISDGYFTQNWLTTGKAR